MFIAREQRDSTNISAIRAESGEIHTLSPDILNYFHQFYKDLYSSKISYTLSDMVRFFQACPFPQLSEVDREMLNSPITLVELEDALDGASHHKSPGSDRLPAEVYSHYGKVLLPPLLEALSEAVETGRLPDSMQEAIIIVLPKSGKDKLLPDSYRPISLLNADVNIVARVLAMRLS